MSTPTRAVPTRALVIGAHPDDADFGAGGLIALRASQGCAVTVVCVSDGDGGGFDAAVPHEDVPRIRRDEQRAATRSDAMLDRSVADELREHLGRTAQEPWLPARRLAEAYRVVDTA